ncbi:hypothetical protein WR25_22719 [Diploscapter pachys]|uniref:Uncharacterized protein n=1 Tax=Diploscapter pachys TaxID=2018661 RepID=A0A2A2KUW2_9BILA|nr:hypothetical protein WR25_22719 [Diploscapter pachys]
MREIEGRFEKDRQGKERQRVKSPAKQHAGMRQIQSAEVKAEAEMKTFEEANLAGRKSQTMQMQAEIGHKRVDDWNEAKVEIGRESELFC